jgi:hypothetical protein
MTFNHKKIYKEMSLTFEKKICTCIISQSQQKSILKAHYATEIVLILFLKGFLFLGACYNFDNLAINLTIFLLLLLFGNQYSYTDSVFCMEVKILLYFVYILLLLWQIISHSLLLSSGDKHVTYSKTII